MAIVRPTVSILMLCLNEAVFIRRAIRSVLMQNFGEPIEIIFVDDGSSDGSAWILREEIQQSRHHGDVALRLISNPEPSGNARAFVTALAAARGLYYHVLDCDDYWIDPDKLQIQVDLLRGQPQLAGVAARTIVRNQIDGSESFHPQREPVKTVLSFEDLLMGNIYFHTSAMLYRNDFYQPGPDGTAGSTTVPAIFHEVRGDSIRLYVHAARGLIAYVPQSLSVYDDHGGGIWTALDWPGKQALLHNLYSKMQQHGLLAALPEPQAEAYLAQRMAEIAAYAPSTLTPISLYSAEALALPRHRLTRISHIASLRALEIQLAALVAQDQLEDAMQVLWRFVTALSYDSNLARISRRRRIASFEIDWQCGHLGGLIGARHEVLPQAPCGSADGPVVILVSGIVPDLEGLWDEVRDMIALHQGRHKISIISTELMPSTQELCDQLRAAGIHVMRNTDDRLVDKTAWLMWHLSQLGASQILLNPARNDVVIAAAVQRHHAPRIHLLTALGSGFALCRYSEIIDGFVARRPYDLAYYHKLVPAREIAYVPAFPTSLLAEPLVPPSALPLISLSACKDARNLEQAYDYGFDAAITTILRSGAQAHVHIGPLSDATLNRIRKALAEAGFAVDAFRHQPYPADADGLSAALAASGATVYLQSFPYPEPRPLLAALAAGLPVILHYSYLHPMLSLDDICYPGAEIWGNFADLGRIIRSIDAGWLADQSARLQDYLAHFGSVERVLAQRAAALLAPVDPAAIPSAEVPETRHELRRLITEMTELTVFVG